MNTLSVHKARLEAEIVQAKVKIQRIRESEFPDLKALNELNDSVQRNLQLIGMIDNHDSCGKQPAWRQK